MAEASSSLDSGLKSQSIDGLGAAPAADVQPAAWQESEILAGGLRSDRRWLAVVWCDWSLSRTRGRILWLKMALRRVFVERVEGGEAVATGSAAHHLARVARLRVGERVEISDQVRAYRAVAEACSRNEVRFRIEEPLPPPVPAPALHAALAIIRFSRFEWAIEKLTELGVSSVTPVAAARSDSALCAAAAKRVARWRRIAFEAAQQSRRLAAPLVRPPARLDEFTRRCKAHSLLLAQPGTRRFVEARVHGDSAFLVGPEGGWTAAEQQVAIERGFVPVGLGQTVLRSETAALALAAICGNRSGQEDEQ